MTFFQTVKYIDYRDIIKHVNTRWFSLEKAMFRVLQQYNGLRSYFLSEGLFVYS